MSLTSVSCDNRFTSSGSSLLFEVASGTTYYLQTFQSSSAIPSGEIFQFNVQLISDVGAGGTCGTALPATIPFSGSATNEFSLPATTTPSCFASVPSSNLDIWWSFTPANSDPLEIAVSTQFDSVAAVWSGSCGSLVEESCSVSPMFPAGTHTIALSPVGGTTYYL